MINQPKSIATILKKTHPDKVMQINTIYLSAVERKSFWTNGRNNTNEKLTESTRRSENSKHSTELSNNKQR